MQLASVVWRRAQALALGSFVGALVLAALPAMQSPARPQIPGCTSPAQLGIVLVLDDSSSMATSDPTNLRAAAASIGLQEMGAGSVAAAVAFESAARLLFAPTLLSPDNIPVLSNQVASSLASDGGTSFQAAFNAAKAQLDVMPATVDRRLSGSSWNFDGDLTGILMVRR
jgi:hypothetical protein